jgi:hypothetical protein
MSLNVRALCMTLSFLTNCCYFCCEIVINTLLNCIINKTRKLALWNRKFSFDNG